jgi:hypothetical protein
MMRFSVMLRRTPRQVDTGIRPVSLGARREQSRKNVHGSTGPVARTGRHRHRRTDVHVRGGGAKRQISGIVFGGGLALFAAQFLVWLF